MKTAPGHISPTAARAFTLIEVMVAVTIFFMAMFAILGVLSSGIHAATMLRGSGPTAGMAAGFFSVSNTIEEGNYSDDFSDIAGYEGYHWVAESQQITNGLFKMDFVVFDPNGQESSTLKDVYFYKSDTLFSRRMGR
jgi:Tfp pilus assembly protein PilV